MHFIGMQNVKLAWQTIILLAAITERLHAGEGNPDRVSVMTVRREGLADEIGLQALYSLSAGTDGDAGGARSPVGARRAPAQAFKTVSAARR